MTNEKKNGQNSVSTSAQESYSQISIISYDGDTIYHSYGKTDETTVQAGMAIMQFVNLGFKNIEILADNETEKVWKVTNEEGEYCQIEVESFKWFGLENEVDGMCESIRNYYN